MHFVFSSHAKTSVVNIFIGLMDPSRVVHVVRKLCYGYRKQIEVVAGGSYAVQEAAGATTTKAAGTLHGQQMIILLH